MQTNISDSKIQHYIGKYIKGARLDNEFFESKAYRYRSNWSGFEWNSLHNYTYCSLEVIRIESYTTQCNHFLLFQILDICPTSLFDEWATPEKGKIWKLPIRLFFIQGSIEKTTHEWSINSEDFWYSIANLKLFHLTIISSRHFFFITRIV